MKEIVLITGANGMVASRLATILLPFYSVRFLTRTPRKEEEFEWDISQKYIDTRAFDQVSHIIHLAGADISEKKWTPQRKMEIRSSRIDSAQLILDTLNEQKRTIKSFITASAIGYYGDSIHQNAIEESAPKGVGFLSDVVVEWEQIADQFFLSKVAERVVKIRTGVILAPKKGALSKMVQPIQWGVGAPLGSGNQLMSWIHIDDIVYIYKFALEQEKWNGVFNAVAPEKNSNKELTIQIASILKKKLILPNIPAWFLRIIFGEMAQVLLDSNNISSEKLENEGYSFRFKNLRSALEDLLN